MVEKRLTNQTTPLSRFMFSSVILMWSQWELLFTLICEPGALEPSISANYTIICSPTPMIQQAVKAVQCYIDAFYCQANQLYVADLEKWNFRWQARLCIVNTRDSRCPDSQGRHKKWSVFAESTTGPVRITGADTCTWTIKKCTLRQSALDKINALWVKERCVDAGAWTLPWMHRHLVHIHTDNWRLCEQCTLK